MYKDTKLPIFVFFNTVTQTPIFVHLCQYTPGNYNFHPPILTLNAFIAKYKDFDRNKKEIEFIQKPRKQED